MMSCRLLLLYVHKYKECTRLLHLFITTEKASAQFCRMRPKVIALMVIISFPLNALTKTSRQVKRDLQV